MKEVGWWVSKDIGDLVVYWLITQDVAGNCAYIHGIKTQSGVTL